MSRGTFAVLVRLATTATLAVAVSVCAASDAQKSPPTPAPSVASEADKRGTAETPIYLKGQITTERTKEDAAADAEASKKRDVLDAATLRLVRWTAWATIALAVIAVLQAWLFWWQLRLTRDAARVAERAANAAEEQARALMLGQRAYVYAELEMEGPFNLSSLLAQSPSSLSINAKVNFTNGGATPAFVTNIRGQIAVAGEMPQALPELGEWLSLLPKAIVIAAGGNYPLSLPKRDISTEEHQEIVNYDKTIYLFGEIGYEDIFGRTRTTSYCWQVVYREGGQSYLTVSKGSRLNRLD